MDHEELIKMWRDGAEVEYFNERLCAWHDAGSCEHWSVVSFFNNKFRIKPEKRETVSFFQALQELKNGKTIKQYDDDPNKPVIIMYMDKHSGDIYKYISKFQQKHEFVLNINTINGKWEILD